MHALVYWLLNTSALPPEINTAVRKDNQAFITSLNRKSQRAASTARKDDGNIHQQRVILCAFVAVVVTLDVADRRLHYGCHCVRIERLDDAGQCYAHLLAKRLSLRRQNLRQRPTTGLA